ncbi:hypothetical protein [Staphylococcus carnosus]|nr:hypothetical protein [Staphylococcus carnosus]QPT02958.1 hypothetical protein I6G40_07485 [Staphylococcus carnosus]QQS84161.1 hypothetical protein I6J04_06845 [Staphylococcus carnosus]QRQ04100.1 hypothetical protein I6J34_07240 [Staphylococcus carnosus]UQA67962.1 hypothetical protein Sta3580_03515 [Staphylococcus carnosus]SUL89202.1 Uncharacterised protein [Staphylococcus carnosus]
MNVPRMLMYVALMCFIVIVEMILVATVGLPKYVVIVISVILLILVVLIVMEVVKKKKK